MSKIEYKSESREWYFVSSLIMSLALICYFVVAWYALPDQSEIFPVLTMAINLSFFLLGLSGFFLGLQGYNFRNNDAILVRLEGEELALKIESLFLKKEVEIKAVTRQDLIVMEVKVYEEVPSQWPEVPSFEGPGWFCDVVFDI